MSVGGTFRDEEAVAIGHSFSPFDALRASFVIAGVLCLAYAVALPVLNYEATGLVLLADTSIYYFLSGIGMFMTERALKDFDAKLAGGNR